MYRTGVWYKAGHKCEDFMKRVHKSKSISYNCFKAILKERKNMVSSGSLFSGVSTFIGLDLATGWVGSVKEAMIGTIAYVGDEYMRISDAARGRGDWINAWVMHQKAWHYYDLADNLK